MLKKFMVFAVCTALAAPALAGGYGGRYHYGGHYGGHYGYSHHGGGNEGAALLAGLVIGGLVGYFISEDRHYRSSAYRRVPHRRAYTRRDYGYREYRSYGYDYDEPVYRHSWHRPAAPKQVVRFVPQPRQATAVAPVDREFAGEGCRMTREYATTIEIDGRERDAYGTKCLSANGSWMLGRPRLVPEFDPPNAD